jgi:ribonuclease HI
MKIYCDGSCLNNAQSSRGRSRGGIGVFFGDNDPRNISELLTCAKITNQVAELTAISRALDTVIQDGYAGIVYIYTDSSYAVQTFSSWIHDWEKNGWKRKTGKIENLELIQAVYAKMKKVTVIFKHCRAHQKEPPKDDPAHEVWYGNFQADRLATGVYEN